MIRDVLELVQALNAECRNWEATNVYIELKGKKRTIWLDIDKVEYLDKEIILKGTIRDQYI